MASYSLECRRGVIGFQCPVAGSMFGVVPEEMESIGLQGPAIGSLWNRPLFVHQSKNRCTGGLIRAWNRPAFRYLLGTGAGSTPAIGAVKVILSKFMKKLMNYDKDLLKYDKTGSFPASRGIFSDTFLSPSNQVQHCCGRSWWVRG